MSSLRKILPPPVILVVSCLPALAQGYGRNSFVPGFDRLIELLGYDGMNGSQRDLMALMLIVFGLLFGYFSQLAFRESAFGTVINAAIGLAGSCLALFALGPKFGLLSQVQGRVHDFLLAVLVAGAAVPALVLAMMLASLLRQAVTNFIYGRYRHKIEAKRATMIEPELPSRVAQLVKKGGA